MDYRIMKMMIESNFDYYGMELPVTVLLHSILMPIMVLIPVIFFRNSPV